MRRIRSLVAGLVLLLLASTLLAFDSRTTPDSADGTKAQIDLPVSQHMMNVGGSDAAGLCVYTAVTMGAKWQNLPDMYQFRKFAEARPGGSWPEKLEADLKIYANRNKITLPAYVQHTGGDEAFLDLCFATRRIPCMTYAGLDGFYDSGIAHMVNGAHLDKSRGAIIDNNRPGYWVWGTRTQIVNRWKGLDDNGSPILVPIRQGFRTIWTPVGGGWAFVWLTAPPPPKPLSVAENDAKQIEQPDAFVWEREILDELPHWFLYKNGSLIYVVDPEGQWHKAIGDDQWNIEVIDPPDGIPAPHEPEPTRDWNNGINIWKVSPQHRYWINGIECSRAKAFAAVMAPVGDGLVDDSDKYHLSIIGDRKTVAAWFASGGPLDKYSKRVHVQVYSASDWPAADRLNATVTLQEPAKIGGKVVASGNEATVDVLSRVLGEVFDPPVAPKPPPVDPVKPKPGPNDPEPKPGPAPEPRTIPNWLKALLAFLAALLGAKAVASVTKPGEPTNG